MSVREYCEGASPEAASAGRGLEGLVQARRDGGLATVVPDLKNRLM